MDFRERQVALERARQGDREALGNLLLSFRPYVRKIAGDLREGQRANTVDDSDLIQDAFLEVQRSFAGFRGTTVAEFVAWLRTIVLRSTNRTLRGRVTSEPGPHAGIESLEKSAEALEDSGSSPSDQAIRREQAARITEALAHLPKDMQQVLHARHVEGLSHGAIAELMGRSEGAVRVLYVRSLSRLRELYKG